MNPALPGGASGADATLAEDAWSISARAGYTFIPYGRLQQGTETAPNPNQLGIDVHLGTLQGVAAAPTGTSVDLQLPFGALSTRSISERRTDRGLGDLELRVRQSLSRYVPRVILGVVAGVVLPTGPYVARAGAANVAPEASYLTLGRGVAWWIAEADARLAIGSRTSTFAQLSGRGPFTRASDGFAWGAELRATIGTRVVAMSGLSFAVSSDLQWRDGASEPDPFSDGRLTSANAGGWQWTASAAAAVDVKGIGLTAGVRVPLASDVVGNQLVPQVGGFVAVSYSRRVDRRQRPRIEPVPGTITVVDYWASWCAPCVEISRALAQAAERWPDVRIVTIDATKWPDLDAPRLPVGASGLPVIELYDRNGAKTLLLGEEALRVVEQVDALRGTRSR